MLKYGNFVLQPCLVKLFSIILSSGVYFTEWVQGLIFPIYKTGDPLNPFNYRGIAITSCLSKLFKSILNARLEKYILKNELMRNEQIGFKAGCRTSDYIFKLKLLLIDI
jgi:potassium voltage-gated channel Eag-related subfamily H protein 8